MRIRGCTRHRARSQWSNISGRSLDVMPRLAHLLQPWHALGQPPQDDLTAVAALPAGLPGRFRAPGALAEHLDLGALRPRCATPASFLDSSPAADMQLRTCSRAGRKLFDHLDIVAPRPRCATHASFLDSSPDGDHIQLVRSRASRGFVSTAFDDVSVVTTRAGDGTTRPQPGDIPPPSQCPRVGEVTYRIAHVRVVFVEVFSPPPYCTVWVPPRSPRVGNDFCQTSGCWYVGQKHVDMHVFR